MTLADEIQRLRVSSLLALDGIHDYYGHTKFAWRIVQQYAQRGTRININNRLTGSKIPLDDLAARAQEYIAGHLAVATFQHFVSLFESYFFDLLRLWLSAYPQSLSNRQVKFEAVLQTADRAGIIRAVVDKELLELAYKRIDEWFKYLGKLVKLDVPTQDEIGRLAEVKASRDILVHNQGVANGLYIDKSMGRARYRSGEQLEISEHYHRDSWQLIKSVVSDISDATLDKIGA